MSARLTSGFFVSALLRQCASMGVVAVLRRRGAEEAGAIFVKVDRLDGRADLFGPAPQSLVEADDGERVFTRLSPDEAPSFWAEERFTRETRFDSDAWLVEIEDREGRPFVRLAADS
jgi:hypothetical protein